METNDLISAYSRDPVGFVPMIDPTVSYRQENSVCGDFIIVYIKISPENKIEAFSYQGDPAMHTLAAASLLTEYIVGESIATVMTRTYATLKSRGFIVSTRRQRSAVTALLATKNALHTWLGDGGEETYDELLEELRTW